MLVAVFCHLNPSIEGFLFENMLDFLLNMCYNTWMADNTINIILTVVMMIFSFAIVTIGIWAIISTIYDDMIIPRKYKKYLIENPINYDQWRKESEDRKLMKMFSKDTVDGLVNVDIMIRKMKHEEAFYEENKSLFARKILDNMYG